MNGLLIMLTLTKAIILFIVALYMIADIILSFDEKPKIGILILTIILFFFFLLNDLLNPHTDWVSHALVMALSIYLYFFRKEILRTFREMAELIRYLFRGNNQEWDWDKEN